MSKAFFKSIELSPEHSRFAADAVIEQLSFDANGLIPAIAQCHKSGQVLMMAWMNTESLRRSFNSGYMTYWSRSRQKLWQKGAGSGHTQRIVKCQLDCDGDTLLFHVEQTGVACHTGRPHCFYFTLDDTQNEFYICSQ